MKRTILASLVCCVLSASLNAVPLVTYPDDGVRELTQAITDKRTRTPAEQKIDSRLLLAARLKRQGLAITETDVVLDTSGRAVVDISAEVTDNLLSAIRGEGGKVVNSYPQFKAMQAFLRLESLEKIAALSEVRAISLAAKGEVSSPATVKELPTDVQRKPRKFKQRSRRRAHRRRHIASVTRTLAPS